MSKDTTVINLHCGKPKCNDRIGLEVHTEHAYGLTGGHLGAGLELAATHLGWRRDVTPLGPLAPGAVANQICCPKHAAGLVCARCGCPVPGVCGCMGGPHFDAVQP